MTNSILQQAISTVPVSVNLGYYRRDGVGSQAIVVYLKKGKNDITELLPWTGHNIKTMSRICAELKAQGFICFFDADASKLSQKDDHEDLIADEARRHGEAKWLRLYRRDEAYAIAKKYFTKP